MSSDQVRFLNVCGKILDKLSVIISLDARKRLTKSLSDHNGFPTLTLMDTKNKSVLELPTRFAADSTIFRESI
jgi:hypothetical protein